jgi:hypothetical protein
VPEIALLCYFCGFASALDLRGRNEGQSRSAHRRRTLAVRRVSAARGDQCFGSRAGEGWHADQTDRRSLSSQPATRTPSRSRRTARCVPHAAEFAGCAPSLARRSYDVATPGASAAGVGKASGSFTRKLPRAGRPAAAASHRNRFNEYDARADDADADLAGAGDREHENFPIRPFTSAMPAMPVRSA